MKGDRALFSPLYPSRSAQRLCLIPMLLASGFGKL